MAKKRRRSKSAVVAAATVAAIKARKRAFLREVSSLLSDALGFPVRVSMLPPSPDLSPDQRRASRRSAAENRSRIRASAELFNAPLDAVVLHPFEVPEGMTFDEYAASLADDGMEPD